ncbi:MAG: biotin--[acetyl-CoA-carboxylase] ligase [Acetatifactor sp.]|nr:biotin--[acetyl-CoA-carboxylase] ligase [Acetatifactor sp.]
MKAKILALLRERKTYVSGQQLCEQFGVSRTAVWKAIEQLREDGHKIDAVPRKGYLLVEEPGTDLTREIYTQSEISSRMQTSWAGKKVYFYESIGSTNVQARQLAEEGASHGALIVTDMQTAGRGRRGRSWSSPAGINIYFTLLLRPGFHPSKASMLTLVMAHAVAEAIEEETGLTVGIKWPNDIVIQGKKVCGILTEMSVEQDDIRHVVIGAGINVRRQDFAPELAEKAVCLDEVCGRRVNRCRLLAAVMKAFERDYEAFEAAGSLEPLRASYDERLVNRGREVCVLDPAGEYRGVAKGITDMGELLVELSDGTVQKVFAGEVSVRGIYGYV